MIERAGLRKGDPPFEYQAIALFLLANSTSDDIKISNDVEESMAQLVVRNLEEDVKARLQRRANRHGRSMEEEVRDILRNVVKSEQSIATPLGSRIKKRFAGIGLEKGITEVRGQRARPAPVGK